MNSIQNPTAILFDCWRTLFMTDAKTPAFATFADLIGKSLADIEYLEQFEKHLMCRRYDNFEQPVTDLLRDLAIDPKPDLIHQLVALLDQHLHQEISPYPGTLATLKSLRKDYKLALVSNSLAQGFDILESKYHVREYFDVVVVSYEVGIVKPDSRIFTIALERLGVPARDAVMVGDSPRHDVAAAAACGVSGILIDHHLRHSDHASIASLSELPGMIRS